MEQHINNVSFDIKKITLVGTWEYDCENKDCPLCHQYLMLPTQKSIEKRTIVSAIDIGECNHGYHSECINDWINKNNVVCVLCDTPWKSMKNVSSSVYVYKDANNSTNNDNVNNVNNRNVDSDSDNDI